MSGSKNEKAPDVRAIFLQRLDFDLKERATLEDHGGIRSIATVTAVRMLAEFILKVEPSQRARARDNPGAVDVA